MSATEPMTTAATTAGASLPAPVRADLFTTDPPALIGGVCADCGTLRFPHRTVCPNCQHEDIASVALSTTGVVYTYTIVRIAPPGYAGDVPYAYGIVELPEALRVTTTLTADDLEAIAIGDTCDFALLTLGAGETETLSYAYAVRRHQP